MIIYAYSAHSHFWFFNARPPLDSIQVYDHNTCMLQCFEFTTICIAFLFWARYKSKDFPGDNAFPTAPTGNWQIFIIFFSSLYMMHHLLLLMIEKTNLSLVVSCLVFRGGLRDNDSYFYYSMAPDNFDLATSWYQTYQTLICSLNQLPWCRIDFGYFFVLIQHLVTFFWSFCNKYDRMINGFTSCNSDFQSSSVLTERLSHFKFAVYFNVLASHRLIFRLSKIPMNPRPLTCLVLSTKFVKTVLK